MCYSEKKGRAVDKLLDSLDRAEHTITRRKLFSNFAKDCETVEIPTDFVVINAILSGPWLDKGEDIVFWCNVDG